MNYEQWRGWWLEHAETYFTDKVWSFSRPDLIKKLNIQLDTKVLELGFGYGRELANFCSLSKHVYGLELSEFTCELATQGLLELGLPGEWFPQLSTYDGVHIPDFPEKFDVIYSCFVIQHLSRAHAEELIVSALESLAPGGKILFEFFGDPAYHCGGEDVFSGDPNDGGMYNNSYTKDELQFLVERCGGRMDWLAHWRIDDNWGNHWVCFHKGD